MKIRITFEVTDEMREALANYGKDERDRPFPKASRQEVENFIADNGMIALEDITESYIAEQDREKEDQEEQE